MKFTNFQIIFLLGFLAWSSLAPLYLYYGWYLRSEGISYVEIGMVLSSNVIFTFLAQLLSGLLFDRFHNYKYLLLFTFLVRSLSTSFVAYLPNPRDTYFWYILSSFSIGMFSPLSQSIIAETSKNEKLGTNLGQFRLSGSAGWVFSCIISGFVAMQSLRGSFVLASFFSILSLPLIFLLKTNSNVTQNISNLNTNKDTSNITRQNNLVTFLFYLSIFLASVGMGAASNFLNIFILENGNNALSLSLILAIGALVEVPSMLLSGKLSDKIGPLKLLSVSEFFLGLVYLGYASVKNLDSFFIVQSFRGLFYAIFTVSGMHFSSIAGGEKRRGISAGIYNVSNTVGLALGPYLAGLVSQYSLLGLSSGISASFIFSFFVSVFAAALLFLYEIFKKLLKH